MPLELNVIVKKKVMNTLMMNVDVLTWAIPLGIFVIIVFWAIKVSNVLVRLRNKFENAWSQVSVQSERRFDLIPDLVETVKVYMQHERETLEAVIQARNAATRAVKNTSSNVGDPTSMAALISAEAGLDGALGNLFALAESYPDLKANQNMASLQEEISSTENKIAFARQHFNDSVTAYNNKREVFPSSIVAALCGFRDKALYEGHSEKMEKVAVKF